MTTTPLPPLPKEVGWLYTCVTPGLHGAKFIEDRAEQPKGGWVKYREDAVVTVTQMQAYATQARVDLEAENQRLREALASVHKWMDDQADAQSKGGHATFDLMMLREQRDIASAALKEQP